jgi:quercetin dioxygenase-like cupin family protein
MAMEGGDVVQEHSAEGAVTVSLWRGHVTLTAAGETVEMREGQMVMFAPGIRHDVRAEEQSVLLLTVSGSHHDG